MTKDEVLSKAVDAALAERPRQAIAIVDRYLRRTQRRDPDLLLMKGLALEMMQGTEQQALGVYREVLRLQPTNVGALLGMGDTYTALSNHQKALSYFRRAGRLASRRRPASQHEYDYLVAVTSIAETLRALNRKSEALRSLKRALRLYPHDILLEDTLERLQSR